MSATVDQEASLRRMAGDYGWSSAWPEIGPGEIGFLLSIADPADVVGQMGKDDRRRFLAGFMTEHDKLEADGR